MLMLMMHVCYGSGAIAQAAPTKEQTDPLTEIQNHVFYAKTNMFRKPTTGTFDDRKRQDAQGGRLMLIIRNGYTGRKGVHRYIIEPSEGPKIVKGEPAQIKALYYTSESDIKGTIASCDATIKKEGDKYILTRATNITW